MVDGPDFTPTEQGARSEEGAATVVYDHVRLPAVQTVVASPAVYQHHDISIVRLNPLVHPLLALGLVPHKRLESTKNAQPGHAPVKGWF